jgi:hypothetical protein
MAKKTKKAKKAPNPEGLEWSEVHQLTLHLAHEVAAILRYLPAKHPETFCQSLSVVGMTLDRLTKEAARMCVVPPDDGHTHERTIYPLHMDYPRKNRPRCPICKVTVLEGQPAFIQANGRVMHELCARSTGND